MIFRHSADAVELEPLHLHRRVLGGPFDNGQIIELCGQQPAHHFRPPCQDGHPQFGPVVAKPADHFRQEIDGDIRIGRNDEIANTLIADLFGTLGGQFETIEGSLDIR